MIATGGGATLKRTGAIANAPETFATAFTTTTTGWVLTRNAGGDYVIFLRSFDKGLAVTGFERSGDAGTYLLSTWPSE